MPAYAQGQAANKEIVGHIAQLVGFQGMQTVWAHFQGHRQGFQTDIGGLALLPDGRLAAAFHHGQVAFYDFKTLSWKIFAEGLHEPLGLLLGQDGSLLVMQRPELTRLRDTDGDDQYDEEKMLRRIDGGGEHGPHGIVLSPDGKSLYVACGNHTKLPEHMELSRAARAWDEDQVVTRLWDANGHARGILAPGGYICKTDPDGKSFELISYGYRNEYDIAFNAVVEGFLATVLGGRAEGMGGLQISDGRLQIGFIRDELELALNVFGEQIGFNVHTQFAILIKPD